MTDKVDNKHNSDELVRRGVINGVEWQRIEEKYGTVFTSRDLYNNIPCAMGTTVLSAILVGTGLFSELEADLIAENGVGPR